MPISEPPPGHSFREADPPKWTQGADFEKNRVPKWTPFLSQVGQKHVHKNAQKRPRMQQASIGTPRGVLDPIWEPFGGHFVVIWDHLGTNSGQFWLILNMHVFTLCISIRTLHATENPQANSPFWGRRGAKQFELVNSTNTN